MDRGYCFGDVSEKVYFSDVNSLTAIGPYFAHRFSWASFKLNNVLNFYLLTTFDISKYS
jgi:hypothetical protein